MPSRSKFDHKQFSRRLQRLTLPAALSLTLLAVFLAGCAAPAPAAELEKPASGAGTLPAEISVKEAFTRVSAGAFLLDVRTPEEWNEAHIEGATLIPVTELESRLGEVPQDQEIVVICRSGNRSQVGRDILLKAGFSQVTSVSGGIIDWRAAGYPTVSGP